MNNDDQKKSNERAVKVAISVAVGILLLAAADKGYQKYQKYKEIADIRGSYAEISSDDTFGRNRPYELHIYDGCISFKTVFGSDCTSERKLCKVRRLGLIQYRSFTEKYVSSKSCGSSGSDPEVKALPIEFTIRKDGNRLFVQSQEGYSYVFQEM